MIIQTRYGYAFQYRAVSASFYTIWCCSILCDSNPEYELRFLLLKDEGEQYRTFRSLLPNIKKPHPLNRLNIWFFEKWTQFYGIFYQLASTTDLISPSISLGFFRWGWFFRYGWRYAFSSSLSPEYTTRWFSATAYLISSLQPSKTTTSYWSIRTWGYMKSYNMDPEWVQSFSTMQTSISEYDSSSPRAYEPKIRMAKNLSLQNAKSSRTYFSIAFVLSGVWEDTVIWVFHSPFYDICR